MSGKEGEFKSKKLCCSFTRKSTKSLCWKLKRGKEERERGKGDEREREMLLALPNVSKYSLKSSSELSELRPPTKMRFTYTHTHTHTHTHTEYKEREIEMIFATK